MAHPRQAWATKISHKESYVYTRYEATAIIDATAGVGHQISLNCLHWAWCRHCKIMVAGSRKSQKDFGHRTHKHDLIRKLCIRRLFKYAQRRAQIARPRMPDGRMGFCDALARRAHWQYQWPSGGLILEEFGAISPSWHNKMGAGAISVSASLWRPATLRHTVPLDSVHALALQGPSIDLHGTELVFILPVTSDSQLMEVCSQQVITAYFLTVWILHCYIWHCDCMLHQAAVWINIIDCKEWNYVETNHYRSWIVPPKSPDPNGAYPGTLL